MRSSGWSPHDEILTLVRVMRELAFSLCSLPCEDTMRSGQSATRKRILTRRRWSWHLDLRLSASRTEKIHFCCLQAPTPPRLWYFVTAAQTDLALFSSSKWKSLWSPSILRYNFPNNQDSPCTLWFVNFFIYQNCYKKFPYFFLINCFQSMLPL